MFFGEMFCVLVVAVLLSQHSGTTSSRVNRNSSQSRICERVCLRSANAPSTKIRSLFMTMGCQCLQQNVQRDLLRHRRSVDEEKSTSSSNALNQTLPTKVHKSPASTTLKVFECRRTNRSVIFEEDQIKPKVAFQNKNGSWQAHVSWKPVTGKDLKRLEYYRVEWIENVPGKDAMTCESVPKDKTEVYITAAKGWNYPNTLLLAVTPMPQERERTPLEQFEPTTYASPHAVKKPKNITTLIISISGGICAGLLLLVVAVWYRKKMRPTHLRYGPHRLIAAQEGYSYLVSYYPESEEYIEKVVKLVGWFRSQGYEMVMDKMATTDMSALGPERWTGREISRSHKVLVLCSPTYVQLCIDRDEALGPFSTQDDKRVLYEVGLLADHYYRTLSASKIVCVLMDNLIPAKDLPLWMRVTYRWPDDHENILRRLNDKNEFEAVI